MRSDHIRPRETSLDRAALVGVTLLGMAMCTAGIGRVAASGQWLGFSGIAGSLLGVAILAIVGARLIGRPLPYVSTDRAAIAAVIAGGLLKVIIAAAS